MAFPQRGCSHDEPSMFCVEMNAVWCADCAAAVVQHHNGLLGDDGRAVRITMVSVAELEGLVARDLRRLVAAQQMATLALRAAERSGGSALTTEETLQAEAQRAKREVDTILLRILQSVQETQRRLHGEIDALVERRRAAISSLTEQADEIHRLLADLSRLTAVGGTYSEEQQQQSEGVAVATRAPLMDRVSAQVVAAEVLSKVEERYVLNLETTIQSLFPALDPSSSMQEESQGTSWKRCNVRPRDTLSLSNGHVCLLAPFTMHVANCCLLTSELQRMKIRDNCSSRVDVHSSSPSSSLGIGGTVSGALSIASNTMRTSSGTDRGRSGASWKAHRGIGKEGSRRRNIRTPDVLAALDAPVVV